MHDVNSESERVWPQRSKLGSGGSKNILTGRRGRMLLRPGTGALRCGNIRDPYGRGGGRFAIGFPVIAMVKTKDGQETSKSKAVPRSEAKPISGKERPGILEGATFQKQFHLSGRSA